MALRQFQCTITAAAQRVSDAIGSMSRGGAVDEAYRHIWLSTETDCFIGASASLTTSVYGMKLFAAAASTYPIELGPFDQGPIKLSDIWVIGTSGILHILAIPY